MARQLTGLQDNWSYLSVFCSVPCLTMFDDMYSTLLGRAYFNRDQSISGVIGHNQNRAVLNKKKKRFRSS